MSRITRGKGERTEQVRPSWQYPEREATGVTDISLLEMMESVRNVMEEVRGYLRDLTSEQRATNAILKRMEHRHLRERREDRKNLT